MMQKILVVEDDEQFNAILTRSLRQAGYHRFAKIF